MSASCITGPVGTPGGTRTRRTEILRFRCLPFASREHLVEPAGFEPALSCTSSKCLLPSWATAPRIFKEQNARRPVSHSDGAGLVEQQFRTEVYISNPEHTPLSSSSSSCNWAFTNSRFVFIRFLNPFFLPLGQTGAKYITTLPPPSTGNFVLHGWLRESDSNRCASGYEPAAGAAPVHPAILRTTY